MGVDLHRADLAYTCVCEADCSFALELVRYKIWSKPCRPLPIFIKKLENFASDTDEMYCQNSRSLLTSVSVCFTFLNYGRSRVHNAVSTTKVVVPGRW